MYAIVEIGGSQWKVEKAKVIRVPTIDEENGKKVTFDQVLLIVDNKKVEIGTPYVKNAVVEATVLGQGRDKKVLVFKKKRRKNYKVLKGHRQGYTELKIDGISLGGKTSAAAASAKKDETASEPASAAKKPAAKPAAKKSAPKAAAAKPAAKKSTPKSTAKTAAKKSTSKTAAAPAAKKTASKTAAKPAAKASEKKADKKKE